VSQGFTVSAAGLSAGSRDIAGLFSTCEENGSDAVAALVGMAGTAGYAVLEEALQGAAEQGMKTFLDMGAAYQHVGASLEVTAATYSGTEGDITTKIGDIGVKGAR